MTAHARILLDTERTIAPISPLLFSGFLEHLGRAVYEGVYDPASPHADARGFRRDVMAAMRELDFKAMRYPGGNFVSGYRWQDGVGPKANRPRRRELAWQSIETNQFGLNEFLEWAGEIGAEPMLGMNFGTGTIQDAADLVEYCNAPVGTQFSDLRASHGYPDPHNVRLWCLGNEMDGPWQIGHMDAAAYGAKALEAAKLMRLHDPSVELVLCGSSAPGMPSYPDWDRTALELAWEQVDYHSMHYYAVNEPDDTASFLALTAEFEDYVDTLAGVLRTVKAKVRSKRDVSLSWDEWNIWYRARQPEHMNGNWQEAPHLLEEVYNLEDALLAAEWMNVFLRRADVLKIACLAQVVNVIAPILTMRDGLLKQTIFYPFALFSRYARGVALDAAVKAPVMSTARFGEVPALDVSAAWDEADGTCTVFIVNRSREALPVEIAWQSRVPRAFTTHVQLTGTDPKAANTFEQPDRVVPQALPLPSAGGPVTTLMAPPLSFTVLGATLA